MQNRYKRLYINVFKPFSLYISGMQVVCKKADISRKTIYNRSDLKAMIEEANSLKNDLKAPKTQTIKTKGSTQAERLKRLREKNKELIEDKKKIFEQNMILTKEVTKLQNRLSDLEEKLYSQSSLKVVSVKQNSNRGG